MQNIIIIIITLIISHVICFLNSSKSAEILAEYSANSPIEQRTIAQISTLHSMFLNIFFLMFHLLKLI